MSLSGLTFPIALDPVVCGEVLTTAGLPQMGRKTNLR
jgi:hypothetical protein